MRRLNKIILLGILSLFTLAISFDSINFFCRICNVDFTINLKDLEEKENESDKTEKAQKSKLFDELDVLNQQHHLAERRVHPFYPNRINFSSADYSLVIYSPPEFA